VFFPIIHFLISNLYLIFCKKNITTVDYKQNRRTKHVMQEINLCDIIGSHQAMVCYVSVEDCQGASDCKAEYGIFGIIHTITLWNE